MIHLICSNYGDDLKKKSRCSNVYLSSLLTFKNRKKEWDERETKGFRTKIRGDPINQDPYSPPEKRREGQGVREQSGIRPSVCVSVLRSDRFCSTASRVGPGTAQQDPRGGTESAEKETEIGGPPSPYIISSPERVAIISRQWLTDRSASQKGPGPIIAATHRPRRSGQSWGPCAFSFAFFPPRTNSFLPRRDPRRRLLDVSRAGKRRRLNRLFRRNACIKHSTTRIVSSNSYTNLRK